jgi:hypothetical protein
MGAIPTHSCDGLRTREGSRLYGRKVKAFENAEGPPERNASDVTSTSEEFGGSCGRRGSHRAANLEYIFELEKQRRSRPMQKRAL